MTRVCITILACFLFFVLGAVGEVMPNLFYGHGYPKDDTVLPSITRFYEASFPINSERFILSSLPFYAAMIGALLFSFQSNPGTASQKFLEHTLIIVLLYGIHFGCYILALLAPCMLNLGVEMQPWTFLNGTLVVAGIVLWLTVLVLFIRLFCQKR
jgi:hypothetical protein